MGAIIEKCFVDPDILPGGSLCLAAGNGSDAGGVNIDCDDKFYGGVQVVCLMCIYAYVLSWSSNMISDGSELLLLVPSWRDVVGTVVLPILGAVPDGAIVLFSGLGSDAAAQGFAP